MKKTVLILLTFFTISSAFSQQSLNDYKYIIVPNKFDFLKEADEYRLNSLTKFLFEKYNFEAIMIEDDVFPSDYTQNNCLGLKADVLKDSNLFKTKLTVQLKNCRNEVIYTSSQGESRAKNIKVAYYEALREAFKSFETKNYSYNPKKTISIIAKKEVETIEEEQEEIEKLKKEVKELRDNKKTEMIDTEKTEIVTVINKEILKTETETKSKVSSNSLRAEAIPESVFGYHLLNNEGQQVYTLLFSGKENLYIVKGRDAVIYKLNNKWVIAEVEDKDLQVKILDIKF
ncbi:hypothetical protein [Lacinutrix sp.]|uniref:hypothetical protein n=1 Tax=Lacinutrix sp. TaxID=1937692 RepID=UPI0025BE8B13|nr:hypothetical protein [Lacinutrix sp.]